MQQTLEIKRISSPDIHQPLDKWQPEQPWLVHLTLDLVIAHPDQPEGDLFRLEVVTPRALEQMDEYILAWDRPLVIPYFDYPQIQAHLEEVLVKCGRVEWPDCCKALRRHFHWPAEES